MFYIDIHNWSKSLSSKMILYGDKSRIIFNLEESIEYENRNL